MADLPPGGWQQLAGGTDLMPSWQLSRTMPAQLVDLKDLTELTGIHDGEGAVTIGALTTLAEVERNPLVERYCPALAAAAREFAGVQIRHRATVGGNICNASPAGDTLPPLYAHGATVRLVSPAGERELPLEQFITGPGETRRSPGELLAAVIIPKRPGSSQFVKLGLRDSMAIAVVNFALTAKVENGGFSALTVAAGAMAPTVVHLQEFTGAVLAGATLPDALPLVDNDIAPISDLRASADYRRQVLKNLLEICVTQLMANGTHD